MILGITGGIGAGKSLVCELFHGLGIPIYNSDVSAKRLMTEDEVLVEHIKSNFGQEAYLENGRVNRPFLAKQVFSNEDKLNLLNSLVHPAVGTDFRTWQDSNALLGAYMIKEAAILIESGAYKTVDAVCVIDAPIDVRIQRVVSRDGASIEAVKNRIANQMSDEDRLSHADFVVNNDGKASLLQQVVQIHEHLINSL